MLAEPALSAHPVDKIVMFTVGAQEFGIDIKAVREIRGWALETPLPQAPHFVRGVINLRGAVLPIVDLSARLALPPCTPSPRHVVIVVASGRRLLGLLVDAVSDILPVEAGALQSCPDLAFAGAGRFVIGLISVGARLVGVLAVEEMLQLEEAAA